MEGGELQQWLAAQGGYRQRLAASATHRPNSRLADALLEQFCMGALSATSVQSLAAAAATDAGDQVLPEVAVLAELGTHGQHQGNCHRALTRLYFGGMDLPDPCMVKVHVVASAQGPDQVKEFTTLSSCPTN